jgi:hypothetical protein
MCKYMKISIVHSSLMANKRKHTKHDRRERLWRERERERGVPLVRASRTPLASRYFLNASFFDSLAYTKSHERIETAHRHHPQR